MLARYVGAGNLQSEGNTFESPETTDAELEDYSDIDDGALEW